MTGGVDTRLAGLLRSLSALDWEPHSPAHDGTLEPAGLVAALAGASPILLRAGLPLTGATADHGPLPRDGEWVRIEPGHATVRVASLLGGDSRAVEVARVIVESTEEWCCDAPKCETTRRRHDVSIESSDATAVSAERCARWIIHEGCDEATAHAIASGLRQALGFDASPPSAPRADGAAVAPEPILSAEELARWSLRCEAGRWVVRDRASRGPRAALAWELALLGATAVVAGAAGLGASSAWAAHDAERTAILGLTTFVAALAAFALANIAIHSARYRADGAPVVYAFRDRLVPAPWVSRQGAVGLAPEGRYGAGLPIADIARIAEREEGGERVLLCEGVHGPIELGRFRSERLARHWARTLSRVIEMARHGVALLVVLVASVALHGCGPASNAFGAERQVESARNAGACAANATAPSPLPGVSEVQRTAAYWIGRQSDPDGIVMSVDAIRAHAQALEAHDRANPGTDALAPFDLLAPSDAARLLEELNLRLGYVRTRVEKGEYVARDGSRLDAKAFASWSALPPSIASGGPAELRVALDLVPLRCVPRGAAIHKKGPAQEAFDRNLCSTLRPQEPIAVLGTWPGGMRLVRSRTVLGWIAPESPLSPPVSADRQRAIAHGPWLRVNEATALQGASLAAKVPPHTFIPSVDGGRALFATTAGLDVSQPLTGVETVRPLTRRALFEEAFRYLDTPYGWGGARGGRDCSEFLAGVFAAFGIALPRHSGGQALAGSMSIDLSGVTDEGQRLALIDAAAQRGIVILSMPGHVMLHLGRTEDGAPMVMHAFAEYLRRCDSKDPGETLMHVDRVQVSDLRLGAGTSRRSFLERLNRITIFGESPGHALGGVVERREAAPVAARGACSGGGGAPDVAVIVSPRHPHPGQPLRLVVASPRDPGPLSVAFDDPDGNRIAPVLHRTGGPPYGVWAEVPAPRAGEWTLRLGDGPRTLACRAARVHPRAPVRSAGSDSAWSAHERWTPEWEALYGVFVEQLFAYPLDDRTWQNLESLLREREHNVLFGHGGVDEEQDLHLEPDCADLPYFLRAYFSWKLGLPFAFRHCGRGGRGQAPRCDARLHSNADEHPEGRDAVARFQNFARSSLANGVHSGSGRTSPGDSNTDLYPVPLTREALGPGAVFADPYGHGYVVAGWVPQGPASHGMLIGADAQPDGTIGRRRFWRGTFLFSPDTTEAGAGFKRFRPVVQRGSRIETVPNDRIATDAPGFAPFGLEQYGLDKDGWYDRVEALVNPRPLAASDALEVLLRALHEQAKARVVSVQNGASHWQSHRGTIDMPEGHAVFETEGPWEDFSTPSRDMRLLIAIDTVTGFPATVRRNPARFGFPPAGQDLDRAVDALTRRIEARVKELDFDYRRSDGSPWRLSLADVIARAKSLEAAYNPNDCPEVRWGAIDRSEELATCRRRAPRDQIGRMEKYRVWFTQRTRPAR